MIEQFDIQEILRFGSGTITFHCQPFKYPLTETPKIVEYEYITESDVESASLSNTTQAPLKIDLKGNTSQEDGVSPDTPKPIHSVSGDNTIEVVGKNLLIPTAYPCMASGTYIRATSTTSITSPYTTNNTYRGVGFVAKVEAGKTYKFSTNMTNITTTIIGIYSSISDITDNTKQLEKFEGTTFTPTQSGYALVGGIASASGTTMTWTWQQLELGNTATQYQPYQSQTLPINLPVDNLINLDDFTRATANTTITKLDNGINIKNTSGGYAGRIDISNLPTNTDYYIQYKYTNISGGMNRVAVFAGNTQTTQIKLENDSNGFTFNTGNNTSINIWFYASAGTSAEVEYTNIQLEKGNKNTYTPYGTTPIELNKIGTYQDYFYKDSGKWYLHKEIGKIVLDGSETWNVQQTGTNNYFYQFAITTNGNENIYPVSNYYKGTQISSANTNQGIWVIASAIRIRYGTEDTIGNFKTWLSTHNTEVKYALITPTNTEITDTTLISQLEAIKSAYSYDTQTNISQVNNDKPFLLDIQALKDGTDTVVINNTGNVYSKPLIALEGTGQVEIYLNGVQIFQVDMTSNNKINIDIEKQEAYNPDDNALMNRKVIGDYSKFLLQSGNNTIKFTGALTKATITRYTRWY